MGAQAAGRDGNLRMYQRLPQSPPPTHSTGLEKPGRLRTESGLNEHLVRYETETGPNIDKPIGGRDHSENRIHHSNKLMFETLFNVGARWSAR